MDSSSSRRSSSLHSGAPPISASPTRTSHNENPATQFGPPSWSSLWSRTQDGNWVLRTEAMPVPPVTSSKEGKEPSNGVLHILGLDAKTRLLASELQPVYDSIRLLRPTLEGLKEMKYRGFVQDESSHEESLDEEWSGEEKEDSEHPVDGPIRNLITSGPAVECVEQMIQLRHRIDSQTAICLMHDGLGVAETLDESVFSEDKKRPAYVLGQFNQQRQRQTRSAMVTSFGDRPPERANVISVLENPGLRTCLVPMDPATRKPPKQSPIADHLIETFKASSFLQAQHTPFHKWVHMKLQHMIFSAAVDPVCVVVDCFYDQVMGNNNATSLVGKLLDEIQLIVGCLPEVYGSPLIRRMTEKDTLRKVCFAKLRRMGHHPSPMAKQIFWARRTDIESFNGYFIKRASQLGLPSPYNEMVVNIVKAKHKKRWELIHNSIPFEATSEARPSSPHWAWWPKGRRGL